MKALIITLAAILLLSCSDTVEQPYLKFEITKTSYTEYSDKYLKHTGNPAIKLIDTTVLVFVDSAFTYEDIRIAYPDRINIMNQHNQVTIDNEWKGWTMMWSETKYTFKQL